MFKLKMKETELRSAGTELNMETGFDAILMQILFIWLHKMGKTEE